VWLVSTVLVLPAQQPGYSSGVGAFLNGDVPSRLVRAEAGPVSLAARTCSAISGMAPSAPLTVVAFGDSALLLPAVALAQRTAHRLVVEYVLVDAELPPVTETWPDARVTVVTDDDGSAASVQGRLRGWSVVGHAEFARWRPEPA